MTLSLSAFCHALAFSRGADRSGAVTMIGDVSVMGPARGGTGVWQSPEAAGASHAVQPRTRVAIRPIGMP
ncbi:hypothetical protein GCM10011404_09630 [Sphingomonas prati]|nr:hypothetical protein GCM10011404_09630 [Sphingomonas prati]